MSLGTCVLFLSCFLMNLRHCLNTSGVCKEFSCRSQTVLCESEMTSFLDCNWLDLEPTENICVDTSRKDQVRRGDPAAERAGPSSEQHCLLAGFQSLLLGVSVFVAAAAAFILSNIKPSFFGIPFWLKTNGFPGVLQAFSTGMGIWVIQPGGWGPARFSTFGANDHCWAT